MDSHLLLCQRRRVYLIDWCRDFIDPQQLDTVVVATRSRSRSSSSSGLASSLTVGPVYKWSIRCTYTEIRYVRSPSSTFRSSVVSPQRSYQTTTCSPSLLRSRGCMVVRRHLPTARRYAGNATSLAGVLALIAGHRDVAYRRTEEVIRDTTLNIITVLFNINVHKVLIFRDRVVRRNCS